MKPLYCRWCDVLFSKVDGWPCAHRARAGSKKVPPILFEGCTVLSLSLYHLALLTLILVRSWPVSSQKCMLVPHLQERVQRVSEFSEFSFVCSSFLNISMSPRIDYSVCASIPSLSMGNLTCFFVSPRKRTDAAPPVCKEVGLPMADMNIASNL